MTEAERIQIEGYRAMPPGRKLELAFGLRASAWAIKASALRTEHPEWDESTVQDRIREIIRLGGY